MQIQIANATIGSKITHCCLMKNFSVRYGNTEKEGRFISEYADTTKVFLSIFCLYMNLVESISPVKRRGNNNG